MNTQTLVRTLKTNNMNIFLQDLDDEDFDFPGSDPSPETNQLDIDIS